MTENCQPVQFTENHIHIDIPTYEKTKLRTWRTATKVAYFGDRRPRQITGEPRQTSFADFGDRDRFQNEGRTLSATATTEVSPTSATATFAVANRSRRTLSPLSATAYRGMDQYNNVKVLIGKPLIIFFLVRFQ